MLIVKIRFYLFLTVHWVFIYEQAWLFSTLSGRIYSLACILNQTGKIQHENNKILNHTFDPDFYDQCKSISSENSNGRYYKGYAHHKPNYKYE